MGSGKGDEDGTIWSFGYGSNMDVESVVAKKNVEVIESTPAVLKGYRLCFNVRFLPLVEPSFANVRKTGDDGDEVHGVALRMSEEAMRRLDRQEPLGKHYVDLRSYDGRHLRGFIYVMETSREDAAPSKRYMGILIKGAIAAGLKADYVARLKSMDPYSPSEATLGLRKARGRLEDHRGVTLEELARHSASSADPWVSVMGYVVRPARGGGTGFFSSSHRGRDITARQLMHFRQVSIDRHDDGGRPPFPLLKDLAADELEFLEQWLDQYLSGSAGDGDRGRVVGHLVEFRRQQESGETDFRMPANVESRPKN